MSESIWQLIFFIIVMLIIIILCVAIGILMSTVLEDQQKTIDYERKKLNKWLKKSRRRYNNRNKGK